jgi:hypothetical protein
MPHRRTSRRRRDLSQLPNLITALTAIGALVFTGLSLLAAREQLDIARADQLTERFARAVEHLGNDKPEIRLSAVLALERIAHDSVTHREPIGELLAAFVRRKRPLPGPCAVSFERHEADLEAALRVVATGVFGVAPDLNATCLSGADLSGARLRCAMLERANLTGMTTLAGADLRQANLNSAHFGGTDPNDAHPVAADLSGADLEGAEATQADLSHTYLVGANLRGANLAATTLTGAQLQDADLSEAHLVQVDLRAVDLSGANLAGTHIQGSTFSDPEAKEDALARGAVDDVGDFTTPRCGW